MEERKIECKVLKRVREKKKLSAGELQLITRIAKEELKFLARNNIPLIPENYILWFEIFCYLVENELNLSDLEIMGLFKEKYPTARQVESVLVQVEPEEKELLKRVAEEIVSEVDKVIESLDAHNRSLEEKELSFNNIYDLDAAFGLVTEFDPETDGIACAIIKHANPCGMALGKTPEEAYEKALKVDPVSAFGGIIAFNAKVTKEVARLITERFYECLIAPDYDEEALEILKTKKNLRVLTTNGLEGLERKGLDSPFEYRRVTGGLLVQDRDLITVDPEKLRVVTDREPTEKEWKDLLFAFKVVKWVKSNSVVYAKDGVAVGIGVGQTSRVDSARCAAEKAKMMGLNLQGSVLASEAFFPFRDSVDEAAKVGVTAIIQPGGSIRDGEVIQAANEHNIAMVFTGIRHFRH